jgi:hypothetical protein
LPPDAESLLETVQDALYRSNFLDYVEAKDIVAHRSGVQDKQKYDGDGVTVWALATFNRPLRWPEAKQDKDELWASIVEAVEEVTGGDFGYYYGGPGRTFCSSPSVRLLGRKALVTQFRGLDI